MSINEQSVEEILRESRDTPVLELDDFLDMEEEDVKETELPIKEELEDSAEEKIVEVERPLDEIDFSKIRKLVPKIVLVLGEGERLTGLEFKFLTSLVKTSNVSSALRDVSEENLRYIKEIKEQSIYFSIEEKGIEYKQGSFLPTQLFSFMERMSNRTLKLYINGEPKDSSLIFSLAR